MRQHRQAQDIRPVARVVPVRHGQHGQDDMAHGRHARGGQHVLRLHALRHRAQRVHREPARRAAAHRQPLPSRSTQSGERPCREGRARETPHRGDAAHATQGDGGAQRRAQASLVSAGARGDKHFDGSRGSGQQRQRAQCDVDLVDYATPSQSPSSPPRREGVGLQQPILAKERAKL